MAGRGDMPLPPGSDDVVTPLLAYFVFHLPHSAYCSFYDRSNIMTDTKGYDILNNSRYQRSLSVTANNVPFYVDGLSWRTFTLEICGNWIPSLFPFGHSYYHSHNLYIVKCTAIPYYSHKLIPFPHIPIPTKSNLRGKGPPPLSQIPGSAPVDRSFC